MQRIFFILLLFIPGLLFSQQKKIEAKFDFARTDHLGNVYLVKNNIVSKYNKNAEFKFSYNFSSLGSITSIDVTDPFKILLYDNEYNQILLLNSQLAPIGDLISIDQLGIPLSELACKSVKEGYWIYDGSSNTLKYFNRLNQLVHTSLQVDQVMSFDMAPNFLVERNNNLFINFPDAGIIVFDNFGNYLKKILLPELEYFQVKQNDLVYFKQDTLYHYNFNLHSLEKNTYTSQSDVKNILIQENTQFFIKENSIIIESK